MGHKLNQKNIMRTPEEKEKIILEYINDKRSFSELGSKYSTSRNVIRKWYYSYTENGLEGLKSGTGKKTGGNKGQGKRKLKTEEERLQLKIKKLEIENARLKKGYQVKGVGAKKEYVTIFDVNTKL